MEENVKTRPDASLMRPTPAMRATARAIGAYLVPQFRLEKVAEIEDALVRAYCAGFEDGAMFEEINDANP